MSNGEKAQKLLASAGEYLDFPEAALARGFWNVAVREAAEVVELSRKGVLSYLLVDYPKVHDVGELFVRTSAARGIELSEREAAEVRRASADLAKKRAPAFYFETDETFESASNAAAIARSVQALCSRIIGDAETPRS